MNNRLMQTYRHMNFRNRFPKIFTLTYPHKEGRIDLYDFSRGYAMLLVLLQHAGIPLWRYILTFHMPLFFFLSGIVSEGRKLPSFKDYVWNRFKRLMIPYFLFGIVSVLIQYAIDVVMHRSLDVPAALLGIVTGQYGFVPIDESGIYWFLFVMFMALFFDIALFLISSATVCPFIYSSMTIRQLSLSYRRMIWGIWSMGLVFR